MRLGLQRRLGYGGRKHRWRRRAASWTSRALARRSGGLVFLEEEELLPELRERLGLRGGAPLAGYESELLEDEPMRRAFAQGCERRLVDADGDWPARVASLRGVVTVYYALLRELRPTVVVETGTAAGGYTSFALAALERNGHGTLVSIDIPARAGRLHMDLTVPRPDTGCLLPPEYRHRWRYLEGDAKVLLPRVLLEEEADVFVHDSLHTRTHMLFEYSVARALMREGALIVSDDILWNDAFQSFLRAHRLVGYAPFSRPDTGVCVNAFDDFERRSGVGVWRDQLEP